jgi:hypothetical protein
MDAITAMLLIGLVGAGQTTESLTGVSDTLQKAISQEAEKLADPPDIDAPASAAVQRFANEMWGRVRAIRPGAKIEIKTRNELTVRRQFLQANESSLRVAETSTGIILTIPRSEVVLIDAPIYRRGSEKGAKIGVLTGILAFVVAGSVGGGCNPSCEGAALGAAFYGAPIGGAIGYFAVEQSTMRRIYTRQ